MPFEVEIPRSMGNLKFIFNQPIHASKIVIPRPSIKKRDEWTTEEEIVLNWLTSSSETDIYGIVKLGIDLDVSSALIDVAGMVTDTEESEKKAAKTFAAMQKELLERTKGALVEARKAADARVKNAMRFTHNNLIKQFDVMRQDGKRPYMPSIAEAIGAHVLAEEIKALDDGQRKMMEKFNENMSKNIG